jgi:uncharacterized protein YecA (UPF0149 family)
MKTSKPAPERLVLRVPPDLKAQLEAYAAEVGISTNAAGLLAIRNFLPFAVKQAKGLRMAKPRSSTTHTPPPKPENPLMRKVGRNEMCPCFSGKKAKACHPEWT